MAREGLMDDSGYHGFDECAWYEDCNSEAYQQGREDAIEKALSYCSQNNDEKEECWTCPLSIWEDGQFSGCYLEQLKEQKNA